MTPFKKHVQSSPKVQSAVTINEIIQKNLKKAKQKKEDELLSKKASSPEVFLILTEDIPVDERSRLLRSKKGITISLEENLLKRLVKLEKENHQLKSLSITDGLTGLYNKRFFNNQLKIEITRTKRTGQPFCLMFIDLDNFKYLNDTHGHTKGDEFLVSICRQIRQKIRPTDFACRYGGDEFTIIMPATSLLDGISMAQRWHDLINNAASQVDVNVSASIGVDEFDVFCTLSAEDFLDKVDKELYSAKKTGKNRVSYPGFSQAHKAEERFVSPAEKDALYKTSVQVTKKRENTM
jgi:diguanylate cyclase (GGDEF)-like protein